MTDHIKTYDEYSGGSDAKRMGDNGIEISLYAQLGTLMFLLYLLCPPSYWPSLDQKQAQAAKMLTAYPNLFWRARLPVP